MVVTRFAPSPTGYLHVGGLRTALYSYLIAKKLGGRFLLRIEDTDRERFVVDGTRNILDSLYWAGVIPDGGVTLGLDGEVNQMGEQGPYVQSERLEVYQGYVDELLQKKCAYRCFCSRERLDELRASQMAAKQTPRYDRHCMYLSDVEVEEKIASGEKSVVRMRMPDEDATVFDDLIRGSVSFQNADVDDQVILKSDGFPTYHLAVVVDDHLMQVTHVVRGEEWISSTPKHIVLYNYFGWEAPQFAHLSLLLNPDKSKLSKRQGDVAVSDYVKKGYIPQALINFVAFLGWNPGTEQEIFSMNELVSAFDIAQVNKSGAVFNQEKLEWFNREYIKMLSVDEQASAIHPYVAGLDGFTDQVFSKIVPLLIERISKWSDINQMIADGEIQYYFVDPVVSVDIVPGKNNTLEIARENLAKLSTAIQSYAGDWETESLKEYLMPLATELGRAQSLWPLRVALSGKEKSPDPFTLLSVIGRDAALRRIGNVVTA